MSAVRVLLLTVVMGTAVGIASIDAATLNVASNGVDSATCGAASAPCRTINRAITNAAAGDRIIVGPGVYGNLNHDGDATDPGEEAPPTDAALVTVTKALTIESSAGAAMTIIDAGGTTATVVTLDVSGITFGGRSRGFTLTGGTFGISIASGTHGTRVVDNLIAASTFGIIASGQDHLVEGNVISDATFGIRMSATPGSVTSGHTIRGNALVRNTFGLSLLRAGATITGNAIVGNAFGVSIQQSDGVDMRRNAVLGNRECGVSVSDDARPTVITQNNIYGNGAAAAANCGLQNSAGSPAVQAPNNFWGAAGGPGPDPADAAAGLVVVDPVATQRFSISVEAGR